jgi:hypothetical protein
LRGQTILGDMRMMRAIPIAKLRIHEIRDASDIAYRRVGLLHFTVTHKPRTIPQYRLPHTCRICCIAKAALRDKCLAIVI